MENQSKRITRRDITIDLECVETTLSFEGIQEFLRRDAPRRLVSFYQYEKEPKKFAYTELLYLYFDIISSIKRNVI